MGQVTIYLDSETERKMKRVVKSSNLSQSRWVARLIEEKMKTEWPESIAALSGAWKDFPTAEEIRQTEGRDIQREAF